MCCKSMLVSSTRTMMELFILGKHLKVSSNSLPLFFSLFYPVGNRVLCFLIYFFFAKLYLELKKKMIAILLSGFRAIGCGLLLSSFASIFINVGLSRKTRPVSL